MKYFISIFYVLFLYFFWVGIVAGVLLELRPPAGVLAFATGIVLSYSIANSAEKKGYSWWENFLLFGFLSTGIPLIGIIKLIMLKKAPMKNYQNGNTFLNNDTGYYSSNTIVKNVEETKNCPFCAEEIKKEAIVCRFCRRELPNENNKALCVNIRSENNQKDNTINDNKNEEIERLEKIFDSSTDENEKRIIAKKLYDLGKIYYWRFIPREKSDKI